MSQRYERESELAGRFRQDLDHSQNAISDEQSQDSSAHGVSMVQMNRATHCQTQDDEIEHHRSNVQSLRKERVRDSANHFSPL